MDAKAIRQSLSRLDLVSVLNQLKSIPNKRRFGVWIARLKSEDTDLHRLSLQVLAN